LEACRHLKNLRKIDLTILPVDKYGQINLKDLEKAVKAETVLVSIMYVNNEVGTIQPIKEIGEFLKRTNPKIYFHTDATQAVQYLDCRVDSLGVDLLSLTGHKIYAPKGVGALYIKKGIPLVRQMDGGNQEFKLRAGTENVPSIVGLGEAIQLIPKNKSPKTLCNKLIQEILKIPGIKLTGHPTKRAPHIASFVIKGVEGEAVALLLSDKGIMISTGSACTSTELSPSHVLTAMGIPPEVSHGSVRFSLGKETTRQETEYVIRVLPEIIKKLRIMSPKL
ncbi:MAG: cysteine desulfurase family protein, partial [Patescibacteria group bacterium]